MSYCYDSSHTCVQPIQTFACEPETNIPSYALRLGAIGCLVTALLGTLGVLPLHPGLTLGLAAMGGSFAFIGERLTDPKDGVKIDTPYKKTVIVAVQLIATAAIVLGALGASGHLAFLGGQAGKIMLGSGVVLFMMNGTRYYCRFPFASKLMN
jgi:hypothetical protein